MLTISTYKKLEGLVLKFNRGELIVQSINEFNDRYSIWLSDKTNIELERNRHWKGGNYSYYKMYIAGGTTAMTEFVMIENINTLDTMAEHLIYIHDKYKTQ
jgi:hypothetical protein